MKMLRSFQYPASIALSILIMFTNILWNFIHQKACTHAYLLEKVCTQNSHILCPDNIVVQTIVFFNKTSRTYYHIGLLLQFWSTFIISTDLQLQNTGQFLWWWSDTHTIVFCVWKNVCGLFQYHKTLVCNNKQKLFWDNVCLWFFYGNFQFS